jgi:hypothetical protein
MPRPKQWSSLRKLRRDLNAYDLEKWCDEEKKLDVVRSAVSNNTFRAFHHLPRKPSRTFQNWGVRVIDGNFLADLRAVSSQPEYDRWLLKVVRDFRSYWKREMRGRKIPFGPSFKLPNLLMKRLYLYGRIPERVVGYLHVPLDSYTLVAVRKILKKNYPKQAQTIGNIPSAATMSFVTNAKRYEAFQAVMRDIAGHAKVPPIALDCLAWDAGH